MATKESAVEAEIDLEVESEVEETPPAVESDGDGTDAATGEAAESDGELVVSLGDEPIEPDPADAADATPLVKKLRGLERQRAKENRRLVAELQELKAKQAQAEAATPTSRAIPPEPTLEQFEFDAERYGAALKAWSKEVAKIEREAEDAQRARKQQEDAERQAWDAQLAKHDKAKAELPVADYQDAEDSVFTVLDQTQRGIVINYSDNSALLTYALGRHPAKLQFLAAIKDPGKFIKEMTRLETQLKTSKRRPSTAPETRVERVASGKPTTSAAGLEKLRAEAAVTGDYSKVMAYKRQMKLAAGK